MVLGLDHSTSFVRWSLESQRDQFHSHMNLFSPSDDNATEIDGYESIRKMTEYVKSLQDENVLHVNKIETLEVGVGSILGFCVHFNRCDRSYVRFQFAKITDALCVAVSCAPG